MRGKGRKKAREKPAQGIAQIAVPPPSSPPGGKDRSYKPWYYKDPSKRKLSPFELLMQNMRRTPRKS